MQGTEKVDMGLATVTLISAALRQDLTGGSAVKGLT
jgi:hypothetical protein